MDKISLLEDIKKDFISLTYEDKNNLDKFKRRLIMVISKIFDQNSSYLKDIERIKFSSIAYPNMPSSVSANTWESGRKKMLNLIETIIEEINLFSEANLSNNKVSDCSKVFIVHGHDDGAKNEVARFIEKLGLEAIIIHEQTSSGDTIIEKVIRYSDVGFGVVLYTGCDIGAIKSEPDDLKPRARQNVIFEHGFLIGKIGRKNVIALVKDNVEKPNDISGVVYETIDSKGAWKLQLAREMKASGYDIDMNKVS